MDNLAQDYSNSSALAMELLQSCDKPSIWRLVADEMKFSNIPKVVPSQRGTEEPMV